jgi:hypothetical protein
MARPVTTGGKPFAASCVISNNEGSAMAEHEHRIRETPTEARQAVKVRSMRYVLTVGIALAVIAMVIIGAILLE